ncbi:MAG: hypothetical protein HY657_12430 [Acidobacteria bacterium]|nr:hypothetical protein [Acidobacteriota bacterium]
MLWRLIFSLQAYMAHGSTAAERGLTRAAHIAAHELLTRPDFGTPEQRDAALKEMPAKVAAAAANAIEDARIAAAAASIVFAHSLLDEAVNEYCAVSALLNPDDWRSFVEDTSVALRDVEAKGLEELRRDAVSKYLKKLSNQSLLNRIRVLHNVCEVGKNEILTGYSFDGERIDRFDKLRHNIVHKGELQDVNDVAPELEFIERTTVYLSALITHRYGIVIGPEAMIEAIK